MQLKTILKRDEKYRDKIDSIIMKDMENNLTKYIDILNEFFKEYNLSNDFEKPIIKISSIGQVAGQAFSFYNIISLNESYFNNEKNINEMKELTLIHELCHIYISFLSKNNFFNNYILYGKSFIKLKKERKYYPKGHCKEFQFLMEKICNLDPETNHDMTPRVNKNKKVKKKKVKSRKRMKHYIYECSSNICSSKFKLTAIKHNRIVKLSQKDKNAYICGKCKSKLNLIEEII